MAVLAAYFAMNYVVKNDKVRMLMEKQERYIAFQLKFRNQTSGIQNHF